MANDPNQAVPSEENYPQADRAALVTSRSMSRRSLVRATLVTGAIVGPMGAVVAMARGQRSITAPRLVASANEESLKASAAAKQQPLQGIGAAGPQFVEIQTDEDAHVQFLVQALGSSARPKPSFKGLNAPDIETFAKDSMAFENVGVGAYLMAAPAISSKDYLKAAGSILTIEARHAGFLDVLLGMPISANGAFDKPLTQSAIVSAVSPFIASLNGGPDPSGTLSNDTDILNFALLLEYLEATFYDTNVPKFYGTTGRG